MMERLTLSPRTVDDAVFKALPARVYLNGARRRDLIAMEWGSESAPAFGQARLMLRDVGPVGSGQLEAKLARLPEIGSTIAIMPAEDYGDGDFHGIVTAHGVELGGDGEALVIEATHHLVSDLSETITTKHILSADGVRESDHARIVFNNTAGPATPSPVAIGSRSTRCFDVSLSATAWTVADALGYLMATLVPDDVAVPSLEELDELAGTIDLGVLDVTGMTAGEAIAKVARRGGLTVRGARCGKGIVVYRAGRTGPRRTVRLQATGETFSPETTNLWRGKLTFSRRPARRGVVVIGQKKRYESTFALSKGWDPSLETSRWRDFVRSLSSNWPIVRDVYRKWVLNEHDWYSGQPWGLSAHDFSDISGDEFNLPVPRPFLPCLSSDPSGRTLGLVVEIRTGPSAPWRRWRGPLWASGCEAAIYLGGDALGGEFFSAAAADQAQARITATIESDTPLKVSIDGDIDCGRELIDLSNRARWDRVHSGSVFFSDDELGPPAERDDLAMLEEWALRHVETSWGSVEAKFELGWVDTSYHVGDLIELLDGRALELRSRPDSQPHVTAVRHDLSENQSTTLILSA